MNNQIMISTDCVCDLPKGIRTQYQIPVMYYYVQTEEARFQDTREMNSDDLIEYIEGQGKKAFSSCASKEEYISYFEKLRKETKGDIIHICMARHVSEAYEKATKAAEQVEGVYVVDSGHLSGGMGIIVLAATQMAKAGAGTQIILKEVESMKNQVSTSFIVDSTLCLCRNGKIGKRLSNFCTAFSLHPILKLEESSMGLSGIGFGTRKQFARTYLNRVLHNGKKIDTNVVFLITAGCDYEFKQFLKQEVEKRVPWHHVIMNEASATISCNCGSGAFGVLFLTK